MDRVDGVQPSLPEVHGSVPVPAVGGWFRRFVAFTGPGYMISVGYMDPGNWATDIASGAKFGFELLFVILLSNVMAIILQALAARLGIAADRDLAQACRDAYSRPVNVALWVACEIAIIACDLAEVVGTAIALQLLFGIPLIYGALIASLDALLLLLLLDWGFRYLEAFVMTLLAVIAVCFAVQIAAAAPAATDVIHGLVPSRSIAANPEMLYLAIGIIGATVMPHNLYLHSAIVQTRQYKRDDKGRAMAIRWATADSTLALMLALLVNAAILVVAAIAFHETGHQDVADIGQAYTLLSPVLGVGAASTFFAVALLASGLNSTVTATLAGQIVMEGFLRWRLPGWLRRLATRALAVVPVLLVTAFYGERGTGQLLVLSQVILSMQLPFAVVPLVGFVTNRRKMGRFVIPGWLAMAAWTTTGLIVVLNLKLLVDAALG